MEIGISTASLFGRQYNEDAVVTLDNLGSKICEIFLETYCEYTAEYAELLKKRKGGLKVHSIHTLNTHFEPQLFTTCERTRKDAMKILEDCLAAGRILGADFYTLHGKARFKKGTKFDNYEELGGYMNDVVSLAAKYGIGVCLENVEWAFYGKPGFFSRMKEYCSGLYGCLDIKQAVISGFDYNLYLDEMAGSLKTVHLSDLDENGRVAMPKKGGRFDFEQLFRRLKETGFDGNCLIEVYMDNFKDVDELKASLDYLRNIKAKFF